MSIALKNKSQANDLSVYLAVFDAFGADKSDIVSETGLPKAQVTKSLNRLRDRGLVDTVDVNSESQGQFRKGQFKELVWQCTMTYDHITRDEAINLFHGVDNNGNLMGAGATPEPTPEPEVKPSGRQPGLTNSQRRALLWLYDAPAVEAQGLTRQSRKPFDYFVEMGYATHVGMNASEERFVITDAGKARAVTIDVEKYGS